MARFFEKGKTIVLLGSSGVVKSSLVNTLMGRNEMLTGDIREADAQGRHTTTYKQCMFLPEKLHCPTEQCCQVAGVLLIHPESGGWLSVMWSRDCKSLLKR